MKQLVTTLLALLAIAAPGAAQQPPLDDFLPLSPDGLSDDHLADAAVARSPAATAAAIAIDQLHSGRAEAMVAAYPYLTLEASYTRLSNVEMPSFSFGDLDLGGVFDTPLNRGLFRATLRIPVTQAILQVLPGLEAADHAIDAATLQAEVVARQLDLETRVAFFDYVRLRSQAQVADDAVALLSALHDDVSALVARELRPSADLAEIEASMAQAELERQRLHGGIAIARRSLERLSGVPIDPNTPISQTALRMADAELPTVDQAFETAMATRPELRALQAAKASTAARLRANRASQYPSLDIVGTADLANPNDRYVPAESEFNSSWAITIAATWSPNQMRATQHANDQIALDLATLDTDIANLEDQLFIAIQQAHMNRVVAEQAITAASVGVEAAQVAYDAAVIRNRAGLGTAREVLDAETTLRRAQSSVVNAQLERVVASLRLQWMQGVSL